MNTIIGTMMAIKDNMGDMNRTITQLNKETGLMRSSVKYMNASIVVFPMVNDSAQTISREFKLMNGQIDYIILIM